MHHRALQVLDEPDERQHVDPFALVHPEVASVSERLQHSVLSSVPALSTAATYFFRKGLEGKKLRPTLVLLMASSLSPEPCPPGPELSLVDLRPPSQYPPERRRQHQRIAEVRRSTARACLPAVRPITESCILPAHHATT